MTSELKITVVPNLIQTWLDLMRPLTHNLIDDQCKEMESTASYKRAIENVEKSIAEKLNITLSESKVMLNYKKRTEDAKEKRYFVRNKIRKASETKKKKYLNKLNCDMGEMQNSLFNAHHAICKLQPIINTISEDEDNEIEN